MPISVNPLLPVTATQSAAPDLLLQPGTVVDAQVLKLLSDNLVRIAIAGLSIDVLSEVPLQPGQTLQLAVSQAEGGIVRLAVTSPGAGAPSGLAPDAASPDKATLDKVTLAPDALADIAAKAPATAAPAGNALTPLERLAVAAATRTAATQQDSLAPLFANLGAAATSAGLPPKLQQAVMQVLAQQTGLDQNLSGDDIKNAFQKSGLFLEATLASGTVPSTSGIPDLKAALIVLRQTLVSSLGSAGVQPQAPIALPTEAASVPHVGPTSTLAPTLAPSLAPGVDPQVQEALVPQPRPSVAVVLPESIGVGRNVAPDAIAGQVVLPATRPDAKTVAGAVVTLLQEALPEIPREVASAWVTAALKDPRNGDAIVHSNAPPPPFRGAQPSAQPIATPSIASNAPLATTAHHLLDDTDAAIARQTLLQVASLPDRVDSTGARVDTAAPRWNFEIPFATPQGTAMAQFEISRDGDGGGEVEAGKRVWRARFSLDVEPAGPVHALVSLTGERTSVRMWAERPATAAQLRAGAAQLSQALSKAELHPGDIVIQDGTPPLSAPARAGHFLDRAL